MRRAWLLLLCTGCGSVVVFGEEDAGSGSGTGSGTEGPTQTSTTGSVEETTLGGTSLPGTSATSGRDESGSSSSEDDGGTFITDPTGECGDLPPGVLAHCSLIPCSLFEQDCDEGEACKPWANDGGPVWNSQRCSPVPEEAGQRGDACIVEGSAVSGLDSCDAGLMCWDVDEETLEGECVALCSGSLEKPTCGEEGSACLLGLGGDLPLCLSSCDPIDQSCGEGAGCYPAPPDDFVCHAEDSPFAQCPVGQFAINPRFTVGCAMDELCCTEFCDTTAESPCGVGIQCEPYFEDPDPGSENLGYCGLAI